MRSSDRGFAELRTWDRVGDALPWYFQVATNHMPAKYLIARRIACDLDIGASDENALWAEHSRLTDRFLKFVDSVRRHATSIADHAPSTVSLVDLSVELTQRMIRHCNFCRWRCGVDRIVGSKHGTCQLEAASRVSSYFHHMGEELVFRGTEGSGTIFLTSCNLRCQFCLHPDTFVVTQRGPARISELYAGSGFEVDYGGGHARFPEGLFVFSQDGRPVRVTKIFEHAYRGNLILIEPLYAPPIAITPEHELMAAKGKEAGLRRTKASNLAEGDIVLIPRIRGATDPSRALDVPGLILSRTRESVYRTGAESRLERVAQVVEFSKAGATSREVGAITGYHPAYVRRLRGQIGKQGFPASEHRNDLVFEEGKVRLKTEKRPGIPVRLRIDEPLAEFLGYYCAEGHVSKSSNRPSSYNVVLSFGHHEWNLVTRTASLIKYLFGNIPHVCQRKTTWTVEIGKASLGLLLQELCGNRASNKRVPEFLFRAPSRVVETFLDAFAKGDGCETNGHLSLNTISETLAMGLYALYLRLGHLPSFNIWDAPVMTAIEGRLVSQSTLYYVKLRLKRMREGSWRTAKHVRYEFGEHDIRVPIHRIDQVPYSGPVYNLEVDDRAHTYAANFIAVGNCQNGNISQDKDNGVALSARQIAAMAWQLRAEGCHNINWVGGEPTVHLHNIVKAISLLRTMKPCVHDLNYIESVKSDLLRYNRSLPQDVIYEGELNAPMLWNSNFFMSDETLRILRPLMDVWLPDFKFGNDRCAIALARTPWYFETAAKNHKTVYDWGEDMVIRHLVMPGHVDCCTKPVLEWIVEHTPRALVNVMDQYHPDCTCDPASPDFDPRYRSLARRPRADEILEAYECARKLGLRFEEVTLEKSMTRFRGRPEAARP